MLTFLPRCYAINSFFYVVCPKRPKIVMLYCSISILTNETVCDYFGVIQSHAILGHMVKCYNVIDSIRYLTYYMMARIPTMKTFKVR